MGEIIPAEFNNAMHHDRGKVIPRLPFIRWCKWISYHVSSRLTSRFTVRESPARQVRKQLACRGFPIPVEAIVCAQHGRSPDGVQVPCARVEHGAKASWQALAEVKVGRATVRPEED